ncbi:unnamed protein product, partial [Prunus brigantina]
KERVRNSINEFNFIFSTLVIGSILKFTLMHLLAPTLSASAATLPSIFTNCPASHMLESVFTTVWFAVGPVGLRCQMG